MNRLSVSGLSSPRGFGLAGELDISTGWILTDALEPELERGGDIVLDVAGVTFMDSTGLQILIRSAIRLGNEGRLVLRSPGNLVRSILDLALHTDKVGNLVVEDEQGPEA